jgi:hypothetical protein
VGGGGPPRPRDQEAGLERLDSSVPRRPFADVAVAAHGVGGLIQHRRESEDTLPLGAELEEPLLDLGPEVDARGDLERDRVGVEVQVLEIRLGGLHNSVVGGQTLLDLLLRRIFARFVVDVDHLGGLVRTSFGQLHESEALAPLDDDVHATVVEALEHLDDPGASAHLADALVVGEHEAELLVLGEAFADELLVARLEDVQRRLLAREQHEVQREEAQLAHCWKD